MCVRVKNEFCESKVNSADPNTWTDDNLNDIDSTLFPCQKLQSTLINSDTALHAINHNGVENETFYIRHMYANFNCIPTVTPSCRQR